MNLADYHHPAQSGRHALCCRASPSLRGAKRRSNPAWEALRDGFSLESVAMDCFAPLAMTADESRRLPLPGPVRAPRALLSCVAVIARSKATKQSSLGSAARWI